MSKRKKILEFLLKPPLALCIAVWVIATVALGGSITLYWLGFGGELWALPVHIVALVFSILAVYAVLTVIGIPKRAMSSSHVQKFFASYDVRAFVYALVSIVFNGCYVSFGILIAVRTHSRWLGALVGYHVFLLLSRGVTVYTSKVKGRDEGNDEHEQQLRAYSYCGLTLVMLGLAIFPIIRLVITDENSYHYVVGTVIYVTAIAAYTFIKFGIALYNLRRVRGSADMSLKAIKNVSFADALISLFVLQAMMLKELGAPDIAVAFNPITGVVIAVWICAIGIYMLVKGVKLRKAYMREIGAQIADDARGTDADPPIALSTDTDVSNIETTVDNASSDSEDVN